MAHVYFAGTLILISVIYFGWDKSWLHGSRTLRRGFWATLSALISWWLVYSLRSLDVHGSEGLVFIFTAVMAASLVEDKVQSSLFMTPFRSPEVQQLSGTPEAQGKAELLMAVISSINKWQGYTVGASRPVLYVAGSLSKHRKIIHEVLGGLNQLDLNYVLVHINTAALFEVAGQHTMEMLMSPQQRLPEVTTLSRAAMLDALQKVGMRFRRNRQRWATEILKATKGEDLTRLKAYVDDGGDYHTIYKLCYSDLQDHLQVAAVRHITEEGHALYERHARTHPHGLPGVALKVVSDIDDTLMCSGGSYPAGRDMRYPHNCVYPGILAFYNELDVGHVQRYEMQGGEDRQHAARTAHDSPVTSPRMGPSWAPSASMPAHIEGTASRVWHPSDASAVLDRRVSASGSVEGTPALGPQEIPLSQVQIGRDAVGPDGKASPMNSERASSMASSHAAGDEQQRGRQMWSSRDGRGSRAEDGRAFLGSASSPPNPTPFAAMPHQTLAPPILGRQPQRAESVGESASVASSELPERLAGQTGLNSLPAWAPRRPPALKLGSSSARNAPVNYDKLNYTHGKGGSSGAAAAGSAEDHAASGDAGAESVMDALSGPSDIPAGDCGPTAGGGAELTGTSMGEQPGMGMGAVASALEAGAANVAKDAPEAPNTGVLQPPAGDSMAPAQPKAVRQSSTGEARPAQYGGLPSRGALQAKVGSAFSRPGGESPRITNISECAPLETPADSLMSNDATLYAGPGRSNQDDGADWPPPMTTAGRRRLKRPILGGEGHAPPKSRWQDRPHQKFVHLVFLSARPESFKGLTEALSLRKIFRPLVRRGEMNGYPVLLLGSLRAGPKALWDYATGSRPPQDNPKTLNTQLYIQLYEKKLKRFEQFAKLYPECYWVFVGDNGQGDVLLAERLNQKLTKADGRCSLVATFIHRVVPTLETISSLRSRKSNKAAWLAAWRDANIFFNRTPIGMAAQAYTMGLVDETGLQHVCMEAALDLRRARARYAIDNVDWVKCVRQLNKDIKAANAFLSDELKITLLRLPEGGASATLGGRMSGYESDASVLGGFSTASLPGAQDYESEVSSVRGASPVRGGSPRQHHRTTFGGMSSYGGGYGAGYGGGYESDVSSFSYAGHT